MAKIPLSKIRSPDGPLGSIEKATVALTNSRPVALWLDEAMVVTLLQQHPISVRKVDRHYEVVSGFRAFHAISAVLDSEVIITVRQQSENERELVNTALFELITHSLLHCPDAVETKERIYRVLKGLSIALRKEHGISVPRRFSSRKLKALLGLDGRRMNNPNKRTTELQRMMESQPWR